MKKPSSFICNRDNVFEKVKAIVSNVYSMQETEISEDASLYSNTECFTIPGMYDSNVYGADALDNVELMLSIEKSFDIEFDCIDDLVEDEQLTINTLVDAVMEKLNEKKANATH